MTYKVLAHKWWNADRTRLVDTGDPDAAFLAFAKGDEVLDSVAEAAGLVPKVAPVVAPGEGPAEKMRAARLSDKTGPRPSNKARTPDEETL